MLFMKNQNVRAVLRMIRVSPRKLNLVAQCIRGLKVDKALTYLAFSRKRIALDVYKTVKSVIANAENNHGLNIDRLYIKEAYVGQALRMRRMQPRAKGRGTSIQKPFSHLTIKVEERGA